MMRIARVPLAVALMMTGGACSDGNSVNECFENLAQRQDRAAAYAATEADGIADTIEGALDIQKVTGLDEGQIRLLRQAQAQARDLESHLESAFAADCD